MLLIHPKYYGGTGVLGVWFAWSLEDEDRALAQSHQGWGPVVFWPPHSIMDRNKEWSLKVEEILLAFFSSGS